MTPAEFVQVVRELHAPYLPRLLSVRNDDPCSPHYNGGEWHEPSLDEQAAACELWCDGCRLPAEKCQVAHLLVMVEEAS